MAKANKPKYVESFLEGPRSRWQEFLFTIHVTRNFIRGFRKLHFVGPCITVFGSARFSPDHKYYKLAQEMGAQIAHLGFTVMTGGGPGIMEAANKGAQLVRGRSVGCNIVLPMEQEPNPYLDTWVNIDYFFVRKVLLNKYSYGFVVMPGGYGTMDEFFEALTLIQTQKIAPFPIVLFGREYHQTLWEYIEQLAKQKTIDDIDTKLFFITDSIEEAIAYLQENALNRFKLNKYRVRKPIKLLGEKDLKKISSR